MRRRFRADWNAAELITSRPDRVQRQLTAWVWLGEQLAYPASLFRRGCSILLLARDEHRGSLREYSGLVLTSLEEPVELSLLDIAILMMIVSGNTATNICIERARMDEINRTIAGFALKQTVLRRLMQDSAAIAAGRENITTPNDLVSTFAALRARQTISDCRQPCAANHVQAIELSVSDRDSRDG